MNKELSQLIKKDYERMSSREIAKLTGKRHDNILRDIRAILDDAEEYPEEFNGLTCEAVRIPDKKGEKRLEYKLNKYACLLIVSRYNTRMRNAIIKRWLELEAEARSWEKLREITKEDYKIQSDAVLEYRTSIGIDTTKKDYIKEAKLLWYAMTGEFKKIADRDKAPAWYLSILDQCERVNASLIMLGQDYYTRKPQLRELAKRLQVRHLPIIEDCEELSSDNEE